MPVRPHIQDPLGFNTLYVTGSEGAFTVDKILRVGLGFIDWLLKNFKTPGFSG
jgi:hypothetical protein